MQNNIHYDIINAFGIILKMFKSKGSEITEKDQQLNEAQSS
jgi:hypothetical protein